jgi:hypothetical protein
LKKLYGTTSGSTFDGLALEAVRGAMVAAELCRNRINKDVSRIKRMFRWAVAKSMVPPDVYQRLAAIARSEYREMMSRARSRARP